MTRTEKFLADLVALPSVNPAFVSPETGSATASVYGEKNVADFIAATAAVAGLDVEFQNVLQNRSNVIARLTPTGTPRQTVILAPHTDTVGANEFVPKLRNGRLYGRGTCDTKGSIAAMLMALCELAKASSRPAETEIIFAGLIDEENAQAGSRALAAKASALFPHLKKRGHQSMAIVGEPTRNRIVTAHKGSIWLQLETRGRAAHGSTPHLGKNAVHEMARIVDLLEKSYAARLRKKTHPLLGHATVNVGVISGGRQPNIVPDRCTISIDRRTIPGETETSVRREVQVLLKANRLNAALSTSKSAPALPLETDLTLPLVRRFLNSAGQTKALGADFFCDAAVLSAGGIPSVVFGPGDIAQAHTVDEWISLPELEKGKARLLKFFRSLP